MQARETVTSAAQPADAERHATRQIRIHTYVDAEPPGQLVRVLPQPDEPAPPRLAPPRPAQAPAPPCRACMSSDPVATLSGGCRCTAEGGSG